MSGRVSRATNRRRLYRFTVSGRLGLPAGIRPADGCKGGVTIQVKDRTKIISDRRTSVTRACTFSQLVSFADRRRLVARKRLTVVARFAGNRFLLSKRVEVRTVRVR